MVKESSVCMVLGMAEIMFTAQTIGGSTYISIGPYMLAAFIYFAITYPTSKVIERVERRMRRGDKQWLYYLCGKYCKKVWISSEVIMTDNVEITVDNMVNDGILEELDYLMSLNLPESSLALKAIGYKELIPFYKHQNTLDNCLKILKQKTRNYAKRQLTFMNQFTDKQIVNFENVIITANEIKKDYEKNEK